MRFFFLSCLLFLSAPAFAQEVIAPHLPGEPAQEEAVIPTTAQDTTALPQAPASVPPVAASETPNVPSYEAKKYAVLQTLDKLTARTATMTVAVGRATAVGPLFVDVKSCRKTPQTELPESVAFLQIWEAKPKPKVKKKLPEATDNAPSQWVFSGWMFASSPALSAMDHPVYDVWLKDCVDETAASKQK